MSLDAMKQALEALEFLELEMFVELDKSLNIGPSHGRKAIIALRTAINEAEKQEPVAWALHTGTRQGIKWNRRVEHGTPLYAAPPRREWEGLTDEEIEQAWTSMNHDPAAFVHFAGGALWAEAKLKEKNT